jgi:hypothetical protein
MTLPNLTNTPPGGWRYKVEQTGQEFNDVSLDALMQRLLAHYRANGYTAPVNLKEQVIDYICNRTPDYCTGSEPPPFNPSDTTSITFHNVISGTKVLGSWLLKFGGKKVENELAEARAETCANCSENVDRTDCNGCNLNAVRDAVVAVVGRKETRVHDRLKVCRACLCENKAKVWVPHAAIWPHTTEEQRARLPQNCWLKTEAKTNPNYGNDSN